MGGPHSGRYSTGDPNKSEDVRDLEAIQAYELQLRGHDLEYISKALGLAPRTIQRRIAELILARERPIREVQRWLLADRVEGWTRLINDRLDDEASNADVARLISEGGKLVSHLRALHQLDADPDAPAESEPDDDEWLDARREAEADLTEPA